MILVVVDAVLHDDDRTVVDIFFSTRPFAVRVPDSMTYRYSFEVWFRLTSFIEKTMITATPPTNAN